MAGLFDILFGRRAPSKEQDEQDEAELLLIRREFGRAEARAERLERELRIVTNEIQSRKR